MTGAVAPESIVEWSRPPGLGGIVILRASNCTSGFNVFHDSYDVCELRRGACQYTYRGRHLAGQPGALQLFEPGESHSTPRVHLAGTIRVVHLPKSLIGTYASELELTSRAVHWRSFTLERQDLFKAVERFNDCLGSPSMTLERQSRLASLIETLLRAGAEEAPSPISILHEPLAIRRARDYLLARAEEDISLDDLARVAGLSRFHFLRVFKLRFGCPPHAFLMQVRLTKARSLLHAGYPPAQVAVTTGFFDQSHFTRYFKKAWRVTPSEYARALRGG